MLNSDSAKLLYEQLSADIRQDILAKKYLPGQRIPSEEEFCNLFGISRITVRRAIQDLVEQGQLEKKRGKGTFVVQQQCPVTLDCKALGFANVMRKTGHTPHHIILTKSLQAAGPAAARLEIPENEPVFYIRRVIYEDGSPMSVDEVYVRAARFPGLMDEIGVDVSLYQVLREKYGVSCSTSRLELRIAIADAAVGELLNYPAGEPLYEHDKVVRDGSGEIVHYSHTLIRADRIYYIIDVGGGSATSMHADLRGPH